MKRVAILGHGYVGKGMANMFRAAFDVSIFDPAQVEYQNSLAVQGADLAVICVPTPQSGDGSADTSMVEDSVRFMDAPLILIKSTVPPGTTDKLAIRYNKAVHFSPEYMGEPKNFVPPWKYPDPRRPEMHDWVTVGGPRASEVLDYFAAVMAPSSRFHACDAIEAELAKYMENCYFAAKVTFANEFARIAEAFGADYKRVRELWLLDPRMEADHTMVFRDNPGFGGKCLPKDLAAIISAAREAGTEPILLSAVQEANNEYRRSDADRRVAAGPAVPAKNTARAPHGGGQVSRRSGNGLHRQA